MKGKGLYFLRTTPPGKQVNPSGTNDNEVLFGEISEHTITSLNTLVNFCFKPLVEKLDNNDWGACGEEQKKEFSHIFDKISNEVREAIKSLQSNITLQPYPEKYKEYLKSNGGGKSNPEMTSELERIFGEWTD